MNKKYKFNNLETEFSNKKIFSPNFIKDIGGVAKYKGGFFNIARMVLMAVISSSLIFLVVKAAPPLNPYSPGETLAPTCSPGDPNCTIVAPAVSGANSDITSLSGLTTALSVGQGGTGLSAIAANKLLYSPSLNTLASLSLDQTLGISSGVISVSDNSITGAKIALGSDTMGDIMYYNGTDWARLGVGTSGQYLKTQGFGTAPQWTTLDDIPGNAIDDDALDWAHFNDVMTLDATTTIDMAEGDLNFHSGTLYIDNAGKVGVGTTSPQDELAVYISQNDSTQVESRNIYTGDQSTAGFVARSDVAAGGFGVTSSAYNGGSAYGYSLGHFANRIGVTSYSVANGLDLIASGASSDMRFYTGGVLSANERIRIDSAGNVGIGTTASDKKLEINSATGANLRLTYNDSNGTATYYSDFAMSSSGDLTISATGGDVSLSDENLTTTGTISAEQLTTTDDLTVTDTALIDGTLTLATGSITDSTGAISFGDENLTTAGIFQAEHLISTDDTDINDNLTVGDLIIDEATGVLAFSGNTSASILTTSASNNILTIGGSNQTNNENLTFDFETTANKVLVATGTGVTSVDFGTINLETDYIDVSSGTIANVSTISYADGQIIGTASNAITIGDSGDTLALTSSDWVISTAGALTGITGITNDGNYNQTGTGTFSTGTGAVSLNGATSITGSNTFTVGAGLTTLGGNLSVTGTAWTATPTISGQATMTSGFDSNATSTVAGLTVDGNGDLTVSNGTLSVATPSTAGNASLITANSLTSGNILSLTSNSTAAIAGNTGLNIAISGANGTAGITRYGLKSAVTATNATSGANIAGYFSASGAITANYGLIVENGNVGIGTTAPTAVLNLKAGTATANTAPLKFTSGTLLATPEAGAIEFLTDAYYGAITTGPARKTFAFLESPVFTGTVTMPSPFTLGATSVTTTGTQLNYLNSAMGITGTASTNLVFSTSPTLVTPILGVASATSINKVSITTPATGSTLTIADGKVLTASDSATLATNSITLGGGEVITFSATNALSLLTTGTTSVTLPTSGTLYGTATGSITSSQLLTSLSDETGSGSAVFATSPTLVTPALGAATYTTLSGGNITDSALTAGQVTFAGTGGILSNDADLTFSTDTLSATKLLSSTSVSTPSLISAGAMTITPLAGQNLNVALSTTGDFAVNTSQLYVDTSANNVGIGTTGPSAKLSITQTVADTGALKGIVYTGAVNTNQTLSAEIPSMTITTAGRQWATGALTTQREVLITQPTYSFVGASAITNAATVGIAGAPIQSTNATITNTHGLLIQAGAVSTATNSYGLTVNAQTGATNNYAAAFLGGNVGIGLTSPLRKLDIAGGMRLTGTSTSVITGQIDPTASTTVTGVGTLFTTELIVGDRITVNSETGTVTAIASDTSLTVDTAFTDTANDTSIDKLWAIFSARDSSNNAQVVINDLGELKLNSNLYAGAMEFGLDAGFVTAFDMAVSSSATDGTVEGYNFAVDGVNIMTVYSESDGAGTVDTSRIGIGTTTPTGKLSITQTVADTGALKGIVYTGAVNTNQTLSAEIPSMTITTAGRQWATGALTTQREVLITQPTYSFVGASAITNAATVGIAGAPIQSTNATITNTHGLLIQAGAVSTATNSYGLTVNAQTGATNNYAAAFLGGNVGVGIAAPAYALDVLGTGTGAIIARFNDVNQTGCTLATGGTISCSSDINLKKNIEDMSDGLNKVLSLRPVLFNWRSEDDSPAELKNFGFIAQEVELILPKLVSTEEKGIKQLNTIGMIPVLTKAIQELDAKIGTGDGFAVDSQSISTKITEAIAKLGIAIKDSIVYIANLITDKITTKQLCLEDVCLNKEQLKTLLEKNEITPIIEEVQEAEEQTIPSEPVEQEPVVEQEQVAEETTQAPIIEEQQEQQAAIEDPLAESSPAE